MASEGKKATGARADYLILGNSAAAVAAIEAIRARDAKGTVTVCSPEPYAAYGRPLISYLLEGKTDEDHLSLRERDFYERNDVECRLGEGCAATAIDPAAHTVTLEDASTITYGKLLVATGSIPFMPPIPGLADADNVHTFLSLDDAREAAAAAREATRAAHDAGRQSRVVVIGAGLIGLKAAEALLRAVDTVTVLEMAPRILPAVLDDEGAAILQADLERRGIICLPGITAEHLVVEDGVATGAVLTDGSSIECDLIVAAVGVRPNAGILADAGARMERGVVCDDTMATGIPDVFAAGDVTQTHNTLDDSDACLALWPNAVVQGRVAGANMTGDADAPRFAGAFAVNAVDFFEFSLLTAGIIDPAPDAGFTVGTLCDDNRYARFVTRDDRLYGYILLNRPDNAGIYTAAIEDAVPLSSFDESFFDAEPLVIDQLDDTARWQRTHKGYPASLDDRGWKVGA